MNEQPLSSTALEGVKVVELAGVLAGPSVGMFLAELGASVLKIENPEGGDVTRGWRSPLEDPRGVSAYFSSINYCKTYRRLSLKEADDLATIKDLIAAADVLLVNFKAGDAARFGLTPEQLWERNPGLIMGAIAGFDSEPERAAFDVVLQAESGFMSMNGTPDSGPLKMPVAMIDILAAHQLKEGILIALLRRARTGIGASVRVSLEAAAITALANQASTYLMTGQVPTRMGSLHPNIAPYGETFACADGQWIVLAIGSDRQFERFCSILGRDEVAADARFATNTQRLANRAALQEILQGAIKGRDRTRLLGDCIDQDVPAAAVRDLARVFANPVAQRLVRTERLDGSVTRRVSSVAFQIEEPKRHVRTATTPAVSADDGT
jgi:crotonobetainyl-CoA:carnitine CoA-transferase CaiB-like acyl-CoA transferase